MLLSRDTVDQAAAWFQREAARYVTIAQDHADQARLMAAGTGQIAVNLRRRDQYRAMATTAARTAEQFLSFALAIRLLTMTEIRIDPDDVADLQATYWAPIPLLDAWTRQRDAAAAAQQGRGA